MELLHCANKDKGCPFDEVQDTSTDTNVLDRSLQNHLQVCKKILLNNPKKILRY